jgi:hypothetical protein
MGSENAGHCFRDIFDASTGNVQFPEKIDSKYHSRDKKISPRPE